MKPAPEWARLPRDAAMSARDLPPQDEDLRSAPLEAIQRFFEERAGDAAPAGLRDRELQLAAVALMICVVQADHTSRQDEHRVLEKAVAATLGVAPSQAAQLVRVAEERLGATAPFGELLRRLDLGCTREQKRTLVKCLWRIAFADAELAGHEEYLVRKVADHLGLSAADLVEAKVRAREAFLEEDL